MARAVTMSDASAGHLAFLHLLLRHPQHSPLTPDNLGGPRTACPDRGSWGAGGMQFPMTASPSTTQDVPNRPTKWAGGYPSRTASTVRKSPARHRKSERRDADNQTRTGFNVTRNPRRLSPLQNAALSVECRICTRQHTGRKHEIQSW